MPVYPGLPDDIGEPALPADNHQRPLRIVQVLSNAPNAYPLPPTNQGGTEKVVHELTERLVQLGHDVYVYAARGSRSSANVIPYPKGLAPAAIGRFVARTLPANTDIIHDHTFNSALSSIRLPAPVVSSHHIPVRHQGVNPVYVSQNALRVNGRNHGRYVYNGINLNEYEFSDTKQNYLLFMGRIMKEKGVMHAIQVAEKTKLPLVIAGPIKDHKLFQKQIRPKLKSLPNVKYVGAVGGAAKQNLLKHARWLLFTSTWEEPFGLTMVEAMACGTPVLALAKGAVPEVLAGFPNLICQSVDEMAVKAVSSKPPSPQELRRYAEERFSRERMTDDYIQLYRSLISAAPPRMQPLRAAAKAKPGATRRKRRPHASARRGKYGKSARKPQKRLQKTGNRRVRKTAGKRATRIRRAGKPHRLKAK
ncbi:glycosyltransferase family 4 protein [Paenibacillus protaetiae]|uniref:Glycosyltransferase family 4 protein n=2 Tax=Paenibacillus protaetiae TaxID=2509456 RepID=A0A4P6EZQ2_9BACL|nr:glycosyltransferase family 4 protein [Paenibacillus protaetiae]